MPLGAPQPSINIMVMFQHQVYASFNFFHLQTLSNVKFTCYIYNSWNKKLDMVSFSLVIVMLYTMLAMTKNRSR